MKSEELNIFSSLVVQAASGIIGIDLRKLVKYIRKNKIETDDKEILKHIEEVSDQLQKSRDALESALHSLDEQKKQYLAVIQDVEDIKELSSITPSQARAISRKLESVISRQDKKSSRKSWLWNLFFCFLGAVLGFIIEKLIAM